MIQQGTKYSATTYNLDNSRYGKTRLGDRAVTSNIVDGKRYYSSLDAEIYFGDVFIDEVVSITWSMEQATMPLFGYNSYTFDDIAVGARQISGSFMINFTKSGFLYDVLRNVQGVSRSVFYTNDDLEFNKNLDWYSYFDKEHTPAWDKAFNIRVGYGDKTQNSAGNSMHVLYCCQLTGYQEALSVTGDVIGEMYTFIAKDIRYDSILSSKPVAEAQSSYIENDDTYKIAYSASIASAGLKFDSSTASYVIPFSYSEHAGEAKEIYAEINDGASQKLVSYNIEASLDKTAKTGTITLPISSKNNVEKSLEKYKRIECTFYLHYEVDGEIQKLPKTIKNVKVCLN